MWCVLKGYSEAAGEHVFVVQVKHCANRRKWMKPHNFYMYHSWQFKCSQGRSIKPTSHSRQPRYSATCLAKPKYLIFQFQTRLKFVFFHFWLPNIASRLRWSYYYHPKINTRQTPHPPLPLSVPPWAGGGADWTHCISSAGCVRGHAHHVSPQRLQTGRRDLRRLLTPPHEQLPEHEGNHPIHKS